MSDHQIHNTPASSQSTLDSRYIRRLMPDPSGGYTATIHELPGCIAEGDTAEEALAQLDSVANSWIESAKASGYPVTPPIDYEGASGKVALRISRRLHQLAAERADMEGISLNQFIGNALASYLGQQDGLRRMAQQLEHALSDSMHTVYMRFYSARRETPAARTTIVGHTDFLTHGSSSDLVLTVSPITSLDLKTSQHG